MARASAPAIVLIITQFFLPTQKVRIACSAELSSLGTSPSPRKVFYKTYYNAYGVK